MPKADISSLLPKESKTVKAIYNHYKAKGDNGYLSKTLSISLLGRPCERFLWYSFRQCVKPEFDGRMYRLFETGDLEEERLASDLRAIGCEVHTTDPGTKKQFLVTGLGGHLKGYLDGSGLGIPEAPKTWHVLEFKTHNAKSFNELRKKGVKESKPDHYAQMMVYMRLTGMKRSLNLARNKDTDELYSERVRHDKAESKELMDKAKRIITASEPPDRIGSRPDYYLCKWCDAHGICWGTDSPEPAVPLPKLSCRQCCHATPLIEPGDAAWKCERYDTIICPDNPCPDHLMHPGLISFAEPGEYQKDEKERESIEFRNADGATWRHGNAPGCVDSKGLMSIPSSVLGNRMVNAACDLFGANPVSCQEDILLRYPEEDSRIIWKGPDYQLVWQWGGRYDEKITELTPVARCDNFDAAVAEYEGGRVAIFWHKTREAEIREGVE